MRRNLLENATKTLRCKSQNVVKTSTIVTGAINSSQQFAFPNTSNHQSIISTNTLTHASLRSFSTHHRITIQNNDTSKQATSNSFNTMMNTLFVKVKEQDLANIQDPDFKNLLFFDLNSTTPQVMDPKLNPLNQTFTQNGANAYVSTGSGLVDFFYFTVSGVSQRKIHQLLDESWKEEPLKTLKIIFFIRDVRKGKGENSIFYETQRWLALNHPQTFLENLKHIPTTGYWKDLQNILLYLKYGGHERDERPSKYKENPLLRLPSLKAMVEKTQLNLKRNEYYEFYNGCGVKKSGKERKEIRNKVSKEVKDKVTKMMTKENIAEQWNNSIIEHDMLILNPNQVESLKVVYKKATQVIVDLYVEQLKKDREGFKKGVSISLCAKWAPSIKLSADRQLKIGSMIAQKLFPFNEPEGVILSKRNEGLGDKSVTDQQVYSYLARIKYQKLLRDLRKATCVIERFLSEKDYVHIPYERVPSVSMKRNKRNFSKKDGERFGEYLGQVEKGEKKIH